MLWRDASSAVRISPRGGAEQSGHGHRNHGPGRVQPDAKERHDGSGRDGGDRPCRTHAGAGRRGDERHEGAQCGRDLRDLRPRRRNARCGHRREPRRANQPPRTWGDRNVRGKRFRPACGRQRDQALAARRIRPPGKLVRQPELQEAHACRGMGSGACEGRAVGTRRDRDSNGRGGRRGSRRIR